MIRPQPYKLKCPKCGYSKIVRPTSDVVNTIEESPFCPKCGTFMERKEVSTFDNIIISIFK